MKANIEVLNTNQGIHEDRQWLHLWGRDSRGRIGLYKLWGQTAEAFLREAHRMLDDHQSIGEARVIVEVTGEWKDTRFRNQENKEKNGRAFAVDTFSILSGPALEIARWRRMAAKALSDAEEHRSEGRMGHAYRTAAELVASLCNRPLDLSGMEADLEAMDDVEFGPVIDPEASAAARFAAMDAPADAIDPPAEEAAIAEAGSRSSPEPVEEIAMAEPDGADADAAEEEEPAPAPVQVQGPAEEAAQPAAPERRAPPPAVRRPPAISPPRA